MAPTLAAHDNISVAVAGVGAILASLASVGVNIVLVGRISGSRLLVRKLGRATLAPLSLGVVDAFLTARLAEVA